MEKLRHYFENDLNYCCRIAVKMEKPYDEVEAYFIVDFNSGTVYVSAYFKNHIQLEEYKNFIDYIVQNPSQHIHNKIVLPHEKFALGRHIGIKNEKIVTVEAKFYSNDVEEGWSSFSSSPRIFIYAEQPLSQNDLKSLVDYGNSKNRRIKFLSSQYFEEVELHKHPVAFISHDSRDKDIIARPIAEILTRKKIPVWFDEFSLNPGDSLVESIDEGIKKCKKCILILSPNFLTNTGWTREEFNRIVTKKMYEKSKPIIPIWVDVTSQQIYDYDSSLADIVAIEWRLGLDQVCKKLESLLT